MTAALLLLAFVLTALGVAAGVGLAAGVAAYCASAALGHLAAVARRRLARRPGGPGAV